MRIALVTDGIYPYVMGGMQKHSYYLCKYLVKLGVEIDLYHTNQSAFDISKLDCFTEDERKLIHSIVIPFPASDKIPGHYLRSSFRYALAVHQAFLERPPVDFIYAKGFTGWKLAMEKQAQRLKTPLAVNFHGYEMFQPAPNFKAWLEQKMLLRGPVKYICQAADFVFSYGSKVTDIVQSIPVADNKIIELPTGIEEAWLNTESIAERTILRFLFVGRFERRKGMEELHQAIQKLRTSHAEFHFIGPIPEIKKIADSRVIYHGALDKQDAVRALFQTCDVLICPSYSEGMPNVILEAMASGLAILATDVGAINLLVGAENGILFKLEDLNKLETYIQQFIEMDQGKLIALKMRSIEKVREQFLWDAIAKRHLQFFEQISTKNKA